MVCNALREYRFESYRNATKLKNVNHSHELKSCNIFAQEINIQASPSTIDVNKNEHIIERSNEMGSGRPRVIRILVFIVMSDKETYAEMLKDPRWVAKSKEIKIWDRGVCQLCGNSENLQVHHLCYDKSR